MRQPVVLFWMAATEDQLGTVQDHSCGVGMRIDVSLVPRRAKLMTPYEVMLSESQERMLVIPRPGRERDVERIFQKWELHGSQIGQVTTDEVLEIRDGSEVVASLPPRSLADDAPEYDISGLAGAYDRGEGEVTGARRGTRGPTWPREGPPSTTGTSHEASGGLQKIGLELLELLGSSDVASRAVLYRTYDQMVGTDTIVGPGADAAVMRIKGRPDGIAISLDAQPRVASLDPFVGAAAAVAEATRNLVCVGAEPLAITDCLNLGNPERPEGAWQLERTVAGITAACDALEVPVVSGNVSLYNATAGRDIWPTATIGAVGRIADVTKHIAARTGGPGDLVLLAGSAQVSLAASTYAALRGHVEGTVRIDLQLEARLQRFVRAAHARGAIRAAHDRAEGGLAVALAELAIRERVGMKVTLPAVRGIDKRVMLFGEGPSGIVLVIRTSDELLVRAIATEHDVPLWTLGTIGGDLLEIAPVLGTPVDALARAHREGLGRALGREV